MTAHGEIVYVVFEFDTCVNDLSLFKAIIGDMC